MTFLHWLTIIWLASLIFAYIDVFYVKDIDIFYPKKGILLTKIIVDQPIYSRNSVETTMKWSAKDGSKLGEFS